MNTKVFVELFYYFYLQGSIVSVAKNFGSVKCIEKKF